MANYNKISYGSRGEDVTSLQELLKNNGYADLEVDGIFGSQTQAAVKDYQSKNNLDVDGIVGENTWTALTGGTTTQTPDAPTGDATGTTEEQKPTGFTYAEYAPSDTVKQAEAMIQEQLAKNPGNYQSAWQTQLDETLNKILNREKFSYDLNGDALYQQYKDQYTTQGKLAMMDAMGKAQAMNGGYGSSYAQSVGQQAYQGYLQQLNDRVPELYQLALDQYNREGDDLYNQYAMYADRENQDYGRWRDSISDYYTELGLATDEARYQAEQDYGKYMDGYNIAYGQYRDQKADEQWQAEFDEAKRQYDQQYELAAGKSSSSSSSSGGTRYTGGGGWDNGSYSDSIVRQAQAKVGASVDGKWGKDSAAKAKAMGYNSLADVVNAYGLADDVVEDKGYFDYNEQTHNENVAANGGSYYNSTLTDLKQMKSEGKSSQEAMNYLKLMVGYSYITQSEYLTLYNKYRDNKL